MCCKGVGWLKEQIEEGETQILAAAAAKTLRAGPGVKLRSQGSPEGAEARMDVVYS